MSAFAATSLIRKHRVAGLVLLAVMILAGVAPAAAQSTPKKTAIDDLTLPADYLGEWQNRPEYPLSLDESLRLAMDQNLDIAVQDYERGISDTGIDTAKSVYDSVIESVYFEEELNNQNADPFAGPPTSETKTRRFNTTWNDPTMWGGNFNVLLLGQKVRNTFSGLIPQYNTLLNLTYQQSILRYWGREVNVAPIRIARNNVRISDSQFRDTVMTTLESTESAYWELVFARRDLDVKRESLGLAQNLLEINKAKVEVGTLAPIDVTQAEAGVASRLEDLIVAVGNLLTAEDTLRQLLNPGHDNPIWTSTLIPSDEPQFSLLDPDEREAIEVAKKNRPELQQQRLTVQSNGMQEKIDKKAKRWDLVLEGRYNLEGLEGRGVSEPRCLTRDEDGNLIPRDPSVCQDITGDNRVDNRDLEKYTFLDTDLPDAIQGLDETEFADWRVQATLTIPIHNREAKARYATSRLRHEQSQVQLNNLMLAAEIDVRQKVRDVKVNTQRVRAAQKNRELQEKNVDAEEKKYENGMSTSFQVLEIQEDLSTAESQENRAKVDFQKSLAALERSKGTLLEARNIQISGLQDLDGQDFAGGTYGLSGSGR